jgi:hypothetical protein
MEWLVLCAILLLPVIRLVLLPARVVGTVKRLPIGQMAIIAALLISAWFVLAAINSPKEATGRYMRGDADVRKLLAD